MNRQQMLTVLRLAPAAIASLYLAILLSGRNIASFSPVIAAAVMALAYFWLTPVTFVTALLRFAAAQLLFAMMMIACVTCILAIDALPNLGIELITALASGGLLYLLLRLPAWVWLDQ